MSKFLAILGVAISSLALAQADALPPFEQVDANHDGGISSSEAAVVEGLDFRTADANQDGRISREEYAALSKEQ